MTRTRELTSLLDSEQVGAQIQIHQQDGPPHLHCEELDQQHHQRLTVEEAVEQVLLLLK